METQVNCTVSAATAFEPMARVVRGTGTIVCEEQAELSLKVCLYSKGIRETSWGDPIQCMSIAGSARTTLSTETEVSIARGAPKNYRTVVEAQVNSVDQPVQESAIITAP
jgi:hypothetical protein